MSQALIPLELQLVACGILLAFFLWVVHLVRFHQLSLRESLLWLLSTGVVFLLALFPKLLQSVARALAIEVPSNALFALAILYLTVNVLSLTIALSKGASRARRLAQECALLRGELDRLRAEFQPPAAVNGTPGVPP